VDVFEESVNKFRCVAANGVASLDSSDLNVLVTLEALSGRVALEKLFECKPKHIIFDPHHGPDVLLSFYLEAKDFDILLLLTRMCACERCR
jgi:hypothetical protein